MIDETEKPTIPSKFPKRASRYNEFGHKELLHVYPVYSRHEFKETEVLIFYIQPKQKSITLPPRTSKVVLSMELIKEWPTNFNFLQKRQ